MSLTNESGSGMVMPVGPMNGGYGNGMFGEGGLFWLLVIFVIAGFGGGFGFGGGYGNGGMVNTVNNDVQRGFDQQALMAGLNGIQASVTNGFAQAEIAANSRQMADMNQNFAIQSGIANLGYNVATEACADRQAVADLGTQLSTLIENKFNALQMQNFQDKLDAKNERIAELQNQITLANLGASQNSQTAQILADNAAQTQALLQNLNPTPKPCYAVQNPNCCPNNRFMG